MSSFGNQEGSNPSFINKNNYEGVNPLDGSQKHPNKYELIEKRHEQIDEAIRDVFKNQKKDVLKRPAIGVVSLIRKELQEKAGVTFKSQQEEDDFIAEYHTDVILDRLCDFIGFKNRDDLPGISDAIEGYYQNK